MGTHVRLEDDVYEKIVAKKRDDETFSEAIDRLTSDWSLATWGERYATERDAAGAHLDALAEVEATDEERLEDALAALETDTNADE